jgi:translocation and assembly module TamB
MNTRRVIGWTFVGIGLVLLLAIVGVFFLMRSQRFHEYVLAKIEQTASESTGGRVTIQKYDFHWHNLSADVYGLVIHGKEKPGTQPLLEIDHLFADVRIISVLHRTVDLNEIIVDHPVVRYIAYPDGTSNIPEPKTPKKQGSTINVFDLGIKHVLLDRGEIYYQQRKQDLDADLHNLQVEVTFKPLQNRYDGTLSYDQGTLRMGRGRPLPHSLRANFIADRNRADLQSAEMGLGKSRVWLNAHVENYASPQLSGNYRLLVYPQDFREVLSSPDLPSGEITLNGNLAYSAADSRPFMRAVSADGRMSSPQLMVHTAQAHTQIRAVQGRFQLRDGKLTTAVSAGLLAGQFAATLDMTHLDTTPTSFLKASLNGISLAETRAALRASGVRDLPVTGTLNAYTEAGWTGPITTLRARTDATLKAAVSQKRGVGDTILPVNGSAHATYNGRDNMLTLANTSVRTPKTRITLDGQVSKHSDLKIVARTADVSELKALASSIPSTSSGSGNKSSDFQISGPMALDASVRGDMKRPQIAGNVNAHDLMVQGDPWKSVQVTFQASPSGIAVPQGSLIAAGQGQAKFALRVGLRDWTYAPSQPLAANLTVRQMPLRELQHMGGVNYPVSGILTADASLQGTQLNPSGNGTLTISKGKVQDQPMDIALRFRAANQTVTSDLQVRTPAGNLEGTAAYRPQARAYEIHLRAPGVVLAKLETLQARNVPLDGKLSFRADGSATLDDPQLQASLEIPKLQIKDSSVQAIHSNLNVAHHRAQFNLDSNLANSYVQAKGTVDLRDDYPADLSLDTRAIPIESLMALYKPLPNRDLHGQIEMHASARGPLKDKNRMQAHLVIPTLRATYQTLQIGNVQPIRADYQNAVLRLEPSQIQGTGTSLRFEGSVPLEASNQPATLNLVGNVDLHIIRLFSPDVQSGGTVNLDLRANRTAGNVGVGGQVRFDKVRFATLSSPLGVQNLNGVLNVANNQVQITSLQGETGGGTISAGGTVTYSPQVAANVSLQAKNVRLRYPDGMRAVIDSDLALSGDAQQGALDGRVLISSLGFTSDFDLAKFMSQFSGNPASPPPSSGFMQNLKLNVAVQSTSDLQLVNSQLSLEGQVNLRVSGTAAQPVILGRTTLSNGDIFFNNRRYRLERGILNFTNPNETNPDVNMLITTSIEQYNLSVTLMGPVDRLRTTYVSDPPLPPVDIINLIARGQTTEEGTPSSLDANTVLANGLAGQVSSRVQKLAGLSSLQIDPLLGGNNTNPTARIAMQQRVTRNFLFTFSTDVTDAQREVVQGEYQITPRWSVSAQRSEIGGYALDAKFHSSF